MSEMRRGDVAATPARLTAAGNTQASPGFFDHSCANHSVARAAGERWGTQTPCRITSERLMAIAKCGAEGPCSLPWFRRRPAFTPPPLLSGPCSLDCDAADPRRANAGPGYKVPSSTYSPCCSRLAKRPEQAAGLFRQGDATTAAELEATPIRPWPAGPGRPGSPQRKKALPGGSFGRCGSPSCNVARACGTPSPTVPHSR